MKVPEYTLTLAFVRSVRLDVLPRLPVALRPRTLVTDVQLAIMNFPNFYRPSKILATT